MKPRSNTNCTRSQSGGFTLVEMLVAVALVLLMMAMFASIFQQAAGSVSKQRGLAENDQRARSVFTLIQADLQKRTFRDVMPFVRNESPVTSPFPFGPRRGYFYISTNNPYDATDDLLQFTVSANVTIELEGQEPYYGKSAQLLPAGITLSDEDGDGDTDVVDGQILLSRSLVDNPNQPEADDGEVFSNGTATSPVAEISYFLRGGNLYRRVMLVRSPLSLAGQELESQPSRASDGVNLMDRDGDPLTDDAIIVDLRNETPDRSFWGHFDYSAIRQFDPATGDPTTAAQFIGVDALNNEPAGATFFSLGKPLYRFGFDPASGNSREFTSFDLPEFMGRFLLGETASPAFGYPQREANFDTTGDGMIDVTLNNPMALPHTVGGGGWMGPVLDISLTDDLKAVQVGNQELSTATNDRRSEDLLLANVQEFKVEVWDERIGAFVAPGYATGLVGDFHNSRRRNAGVGPFALGQEQTDQTAGPLRLNNIFDTWHPNLGDPTLAGADAPYLPLSFYAPGTTSDGSGPRLFDQPATWWEPSHRYDTEDNNGNGVLDPGEDANNNGRLDFDVVFPLTEDINGDGYFDVPTEDRYANFPTSGLAFSDPTETGILSSHAPWQGFAYYFKCVRSGDSGDLATPPNWQARPGSVISEDSDSDGTPGGPDAAVWQAVPNVRPLRAIRLSIRFVDPSTQQSRQVTIVHSLID